MKIVVASDSFKGYLSSMEAVGGGQKGARILPGEVRKSPGYVCKLPGYACKAAG